MHNATEQTEFVARDVCEVLGLSNVTEALRPLDPDERGSVILNTPGGPQETLTQSAHSWDNLPDAPLTFWSVD